MLRRPPALPIALTLAFAVAAGACGSRPLGPPRPIPAGDYVPTLANRKCARAVACRQMPDMATCLGSMSIDLSQLFAEVSAGRIIYDGAAAAQCFAATSLVGVACAMTAERAVPNDPSCAHIFSGAQAEGDPCAQSEECVSADCNINPLTDCSGTPVCCTGACGPVGPAAPAPLPIGGDCSAAGASCVAGAFCSAASGHCVAYVALGQPCDATADEFCGIGFTCGPAASGTQPVCLAPPAEGQACATLMPCDALDDYCDPLAWKCRRKIAVGGACPSETGCVDYARCDGTKCVANGKVGASCTLSSGPFCLGSLQCTGDACELPPTSATVCP